MLRARLIGVALAIVLAGCAGKEVLLPKSAAVPDGIDFSGDWILRGRESTLRPARKDDAAVVRVFLETGRALRITQTADGIFISFDRAVVEEYRFGEQREVNVGPVVADRVSGWEGTRYVVETLDDDGAKLVEFYALADGGQTLRRDILIVRDERRTLEISQLFDRQ